MKKIICYSLMFLLVITLSLFINIKTSDKIEVYASGPKPFEVGDVLPPTTQLRISWNAPRADLVYDLFYHQYNNGLFKSDFDNFSFVTGNSNDLYLNGVNIVYTPDDDYFFMVSPFTVSGGGHAYIDIDTSSWSLSKRTISTIPATVWNYYFSWEDLASAPSGYTISFNSNGGSTISDIEEATELPNPLPIPTKSGYTFAGWYYDDDFTTQAYAGDELEDDVTLYAKWILNTYTITFEENGGTSVTDLSEQTVLPNPLPTPTKSGYTFLGWYYDSSFTNTAVAGDPLTSDVTLYAKWELNTYTITYNSNGGSSIPQSSGVTQLPDPLPTPTKSGYTFRGWYYDSDFTNEAHAGDPLTDDVSLYAKWNKNYRIFYNTNGGNTIPSITTDIIPDNLPIPVRNDDIFIGWYYDESLSDPVETNDILSSNITLYASWIDYDGIKEYFNDIYKDGFDDGYDDTFDDSYNQGYDLGFEYGYPYGYDDGYRDGLMEDHPIEFSEYFDKGYFDARDKYGKLIDDYQWESAQIAYENGQKAMGRYSRILIYGIVIITIIGGVLLYYSLKRRNE